MYLLVDNLTNWKADVFAMLTSLLVFVYGPPHLVVFTLLTLIAVNLYLQNRIHKKTSLNNKISFIVKKFTFYTIVVFIANGVDLFLGKRPEMRNYGLFALFILEAHETLGLLAAAGYAKELRVIQFIYTNVVKKNPLGDLMPKFEEEEKEKGGDEDEAKTE